jgi:hypothetical protein
MRVFACYVVSKLQRHRCPTFGALRTRNRRGQTGRYIFIYIDITLTMIFGRASVSLWPPSFMGRQNTYKITLNRQGLNIF